MTLQITEALSLDNKYPFYPPSTSVPFVTDSFALGNEGQHPLNPTPSKIQIISLSTWKKYFHPVSGTMRNGQGENVGWVVVDVRYVMADEEYDEGEVKGVEVKRGGGGVRSDGGNSTSSGGIVPTLKTIRKSIQLPNVWKITILGSEFVESTDGRAKALAEVIEACGKVDGLGEEGKGVLEVEWLNANSHTITKERTYAPAFATHLVHEYIIDAGKAAWGTESGEVDSDEEMTGQRSSERSGLRRLALQGGFSLPNPMSCTSALAKSAGLNPFYALQPDFSFAFTTWIPTRGLDVLSWSFEGNYTPACVSAILTRLFGWVGITRTQEREPFKVLVLTHLPECVVDGLSERKEDALVKAGLKDAWENEGMREWLVDTVFVVRGGNVERLWIDEEVDEDSSNARDRQLRRFRADMVANEEGDRISPRPPLLKMIPQGGGARVPMSTNIGVRDNGTVLPPSPLIKDSLEEHDKAFGGLHTPLSQVTSRGESDATRSSEAASPGIELYKFGEGVAHMVE